MLESVRHKFFRYLAYRLGRPFSFDNHDYHDFSESVGLCTIKSLHDYYDLLFVRRVLDRFFPSLGNCLIDLFPTSVNRYNTRSHRDLVEKSSSRDYVFHSSVFRLRRRWNLLSIETRSVVKLRDFKDMLFDELCEY